MAFYTAGDRIIVPWFHGDIEATVIRLLLWGGRPHKMPHYLVRLDSGENVTYRENEIRGKLQEAIPPRPARNETK